MMSSPEEPEFGVDPWLDACLDEVLGGQHPPDLKAQILRRLNESHQEAAESTRSEQQVQPPTSGTHDADHAESFSVVVGPVATRRSRLLLGRRQVVSLLIVVSACVALLITLAELPSIFWSPERGQPVAERPDDPGSGTAPEQPESDASATDDETTSGTLDGDGSKLADADSQPSDTGEDAASASADDRQPPRESLVDGTSTDGDALRADDGNRPIRRRPPASRAPRSSRQAMIAAVNEQLEVTWNVASVTPAPAVEDDAWFARATLNLLGRKPLLKEQRAFSADNAPDRRRRWTDRLLGNDYEVEFAEHWGGLWAQWLLDPQTMPDPNVPVFRAGLEKYLQNVIAQESPFDDIVLSLLAAQGSNDPAAPDFNPATNYLLALVDERGAKATSQVCRVLLGRRLECAQCHDDPVSDMSQESFWQLAAALEPVKNEVLRPGRGRLRDVFPEETPQIQYQRPDGSWRTVEPALPDGRPLELADGETPREHLAERLVASRQMARATVNRVWTQLLRYGFTLPVDDMGRHNPASHPELVDLLASQWTAHDYDMKELIRWIVLSDAFDRSDVVTSGNRKDLPDGGSMALFSRYYHRRKLFEQPDEALTWLAQGRAPQVTSVDNPADREMLVGRHDEGFGDLSRSSPALDMNVPIGQLLPSSYLHLVRSLTNSNKLTPSQQMEHAFRIVLGRAPRSDESARAEAIYQAADGNDVVALDDPVFWALLNTGTNDRVPSGG